MEPLANAPLSELTNWIGLLGWALYPALLGLYRPEDGVRMPIFDQAGEPLPDGVLPLGDVNLP